MKSKVLQQVVFRKYEDGDSLSSFKWVATIKRWCKMIRETGSIQLSTPSGGPRFARTSKTIEKVKHKLNYQFGVWLRTTASAHRILKDNLKLCAYKMRIEPKLTEEHKNKRKKFVNWLGHNFRKEDTMRRRKNI